MKIIKFMLIWTLLIGFHAYAEDSKEATSSPLFGGLADKLGLFKGGANEPLHPDKAFQLSISAEGDKLNAIWKVTPGHYLYRDKTKFRIQSPDSASLGEPQFPASKTKHDDYLGDTEVYEHDFSVLVPVKSHEGGEITVETTYQGCSESTGICYPPQKKTQTLMLSALSPTEESANAAAISPSSTGDSPSISPEKKASAGLITSLGGMKEPLHPDEAFKLSVSMENGKLKAHWKITPEHYLYQEKTTFKIQSPDDAKLGSPVFPKAKTKHDEFLGDTKVYQKDFTVEIPLSSTSDEVTIQTTYQGCSESTGICYPPQKKIHTVKMAGENRVNNSSAQQLPEDVKLVSNTDTNNTVGDTTSNNQAIVSNSSETLSEQDAILDRIKNSSSVGTIFMFLLFGLGLALTPCVFPMIPILSGIIAGQGENITTRKAFGLSLAYVIPMAIVYAIVGIVAGLGGANLQVVFQNPWVIAAFAFVFVLLSLSMFGFYELQMPGSIQSKLTNLSNKQESGSYIGAGIMGVLSALIVGPCVTAPLIAALSYIAQTGDAVLGGLSLFALGLGMGIPLIIIGTSAGKLLPKAGAWMDSTKAVFGVLMLALAIWMLSRVVSPQVTMVLSAILLIISGVYLKALNPIPEGVSKWAYLWKGLGFIMLLYGALMLIGVAAGGKNLLQPLSGVFVSSTGASTVNTQQQQSLDFKRIHSISDLNATLAEAKNLNKAVMLDFYADWCVSCKEMEHITFKDPTVIHTLKNVILIQADVTANNDDDKALLKKFGLFGPPGILFFTPEGVEDKAYRKVGFVKPDKFSADAKHFLEKNHLR